MARTVAVVNHKGGVGKTTTAFCLGGALIEQGCSVLLVDTDPQQGLARSLRVAPESPGLAEALAGDVALPDVLADAGGFVLASGLNLAAKERSLQNEPGAELTLRQALKPIARRFDFVLIDCPPSLSTLTVAALVACDVALVPILTEYLALAQLTEISELVAKVRRVGFNKRLSIRWLLPTMFDKRLLHHGEVLALAGKVATRIGAKLCAPIPRTVRLAECSVSARPITVLDPRSKAAEAYRALGQEVAHGEANRDR